MEDDCSYSDCGRCAEDITDSHLHNGLWDRHARRKSGSRMRGKPWREVSAAAGHDLAVGCRISQPGELTGVLPEACDQARHSGQAKSLAAPLVTWLGSGLDHAARNQIEGWARGLADDALEMAAGTCPARRKTMHGAS